MKYLVVVHGANESFHFFAIVRNRLERHDFHESTNVVKAVRVDGGPETLSMLCAISRKRWGDLKNLVDVKDDFYRTRRVFVKLYKYTLLTLIFVFCGVVRQKRLRLQWMHLFPIGDLTL